MIVGVLPWLCSLLICLLLLAWGHGKKEEGRNGEREGASLGNLEYNQGQERDCLFLHPPRGVMLTLYLEDTEEGI